MLKFLAGSVTQGSADAFATAEMSTGLANANLGYRVRGIMWFYPGNVEVDSDVQIQLVRRTPTALVGIADRTLIDLTHKAISITTSGMIIYERKVMTFYPRDMDLLIVEDPIFIAIDSSGTSLSNTGSARIYYEEVRLTPLEKVTALAESLNA